MTTTKTVQQRTDAYKLRDFLEAHPDQHDQSVWAYLPEDTNDSDGWTITADSCGTVACAAGWTVLLHGHAIVGSRAVDLEAKDDWRLLDPGCYVPNVAARILGLADWESNLLFHGDQNLDDVLRQIDDIFGPRPADNA